MVVPVLLVHGAWQGSWSFDELVPALAEFGRTGVAVDLPGNGADSTPPEDVSLDRYLDALTSTIDDLGGRAAVVGHSGGGLVATALAERSPDRVAAVVYLAGMCLPNGESFGELQARVGGPVGISDDIVVADDGLTSSVPTDAAIRYFLHDLPSPTARRLAAQLTSQPEAGRLITSPTTPTNFGRLPKLYVEATDDRSISVDAQRAMQALAPDMEVVSLDTGHVPQVVDPNGVAAAIADFVDRVERSSPATPTDALATPFTHR
ncbi:MAG: alpha/beta fold hydrolase [Actinomycetota bacterium]